MPGQHITDQQVRRYMALRNRSSQSVAADKAGFSERTARRIDRDPGLPSQRKTPRPWRTRKDPLEGLWDEVVVPMLEANPSLMAVTLLEDLQDRFGDDLVPDSVRRTLERRVRQWRALHGPGQEVFFPQNHPPGQRALSDFTDGQALRITVSGVPLAHRIYHFRLANSGWEHAEVVLGGESFTALSAGLQNALWRLGGVPKEHRTDSLSAAFRNLTRDQQEDLTKRYEAVCQHYGMVASRNNPGEAHENGTIEAAHGHLKRRIDQALKRRGSRDFETLEDYRTFLSDLIDRHNSRRQRQVAAECAVLAPLPQHRTTDYTEATAVVSRNSTIAVGKVTYSVPSRLIGETLHIHLFDNRLEAFLGPNLVFQTERRRQTGTRRTHAVNYRHVIGTLRRKPQAFRNYVFQDALFPREEYRKAWEVLDAALAPRDACKAIVGLLDLAASNACEADLASYLATCLDAGQVPDLEAARARFGPPSQAAEVAQSVHVQAPVAADYDRLLVVFAATRSVSPTGQPLVQEDRS